LISRSAWPEALLVGVMAKPFEPLGSLSSYGAQTGTVVMPAAATCASPVRGPLGRGVGPEAAPQRTAYG